jgi:hypothetical protein
MSGRGLPGRLPNGNAVWFVLGVFEDSIPPAASTQVATTLCLWPHRISGSRRGIGVVTATPTIVLEGDVLVVDASGLTLVRIVAVPLRTEFEVTLTIILVTANVIFGRFWLRVLAVLENSVPPGTSKHLAVPDTVRI